MATEPELSFGGLPLLHDQDHGAQDFFDQYHPINGMITEIEESLHRTNSRTGGRGDAYVGLPLPNYPKVPPLRVNQLYWPTGAARWARGYFLCDFEVFTTLSLGIDQPREFKAVVSDEQSFVAEMYALHPRTVSNTRKSKENLYLVPLVDERYFWQFRNFGTTAITTWNALFTSLETQLDIAILSTNPGWPTTRVHADYLDPDHLTLNRKYDNAAVILDAVVHSVNQRICRDPSGLIYTRDWLNSVLIDGSNMTTSAGADDDEDWALVAGQGYLSDPIPETLQVLFPKATCGAPRFEHTYYLASRTAEDYATNSFSTVQSVSGSIKTIHSAQWANYNEAETTFKNQTALDALADKIATDYYSQFRRPSHDVTWVGIKDWSFTGYDDHALYSFGCEHETPEIGVLKDDDDGVLVTKSYGRRYTTRIVSPPGNFGVEQQLTNNVTAVPPQGLLPVKLTSALVASGSATANQLTWTGGAWVEDTDCGLTVYEPFGLDSFDSGTKIFVRRGEDSGRWETLSGSSGAGGGGTGNSTIVRVCAKEFFEPSQASTAFDKWEWVSNAWQDAGVDINVEDANDNCCLLTGEYGWAMELDADEWVMIGEQGLHRKVKADADIIQSGTGTCSIWSHAGTCAGVDSTEYITVCNGGSSVDFPRAILAGEVFFVSYYDGMWHVDDLPRGPLLGKPQLDVPDGSSEIFDIYKRVGGAWVDTTADVPSVRNITGITLKTDVYYMIVWTALSDEPLALIIQYAVC